jgi:hypothetical protein
LKIRAAVFHDKFWEDSSFMGFCRTLCIIFLLAVPATLRLPAKAKAEVPTNISAEISTEKSSETGVDGAVFSGISFLNYRGSSYSLKILPVIGISLFPYYAPGPAWRLVGELTFQHTFRSNYNNYYYYSSHQSISFVPGLRLYFFPGRKVSGSLHAGAGVSHAFSNYFNKNYFVACGGIGIKFKDSFINDLFLSYYHSFLLDFYHYETIRVYITASIWDGSKKLRGTRERDQ